MAERQATVHVLPANWSGACYLDGRVRSVVQRPLRDRVMLIVDTGSTDGSRDILSQCAAPPASYYDPLIELLGEIVW